MKAKTKALAVIAALAVVAVVVWWLATRSDAAGGVMGIVTALGLAWAAIKGKGGKKNEAKNTAPVDVGTLSEPAQDAISTSDASAVEAGTDAGVQAGLEELHRIRDSRGGK
jgi:hypothetical protein